MNVADSETSVIIVAKTCGCTEKRKVSYALLQGYHDLCLDKKDIADAAGVTEVTIRNRFKDLKTRLALN